MINLGQRCRFNFTGEFCDLSNFSGLVILLKIIDKLKILFCWGCVSFAAKDIILMWLVQSVIISLGKQLQLFMVLPFHGWELVRDFRGEGGIGTLRIFSKPSAINRFGMSLPTTIWVGLAMLFPSAWWVVEDFLLGLKANCFLYPWASRHWIILLL